MECHTRRLSHDLEDAKSVCSGRYDWTWTSDKGEVTTWINQRGGQKNMIPDWFDAGVTHAAFDKKFQNNGEAVVWGRILNDEKTDVS